MKKTYLIVFFSFLFNNILYSQTFGNTVVEEAEKQVKARSTISKEFRDSQKGILVSVGIGSAALIPELYHRNNLNPKPKFGINSLELRVSYVKESFLPVGAFVGFGLTNVFYNSMPNQWSSTIVDSNLSDISTSMKGEKKHPFFDIGISKNIGTSSTFQLGYRHIFSGEKPESQPVSYEETSAITFSYLSRMKKLFLSYGVNIHLPYYKEFLYGPVITENYVYDWPNGYNYEYQPTYYEVKLKPAVMSFISIGYNF